MPPVWRSGLYVSLDTSDRWWKDDDHGHEKEAFTGAGGAEVGAG